jgi:DNA polymerase/3'-5' exonuclease PolX
MEYKQAKIIADRIYELYEPHCELLHIAGSIRRKKADVKDIEIVCLPKREFTGTDLFGDGAWKVNAGFAHATMLMVDHVIKGKIDGRYMQTVLKGGMKMDLFLPQRSDYYRQLAIRTGSADYSAKVIATTWKKMGWCGTKDGLRRISDCMLTNSGVWVIQKQDGRLPPIWNSEEEFFNWLGIDFIKPEKRNIQ